MKFVSSRKSQKGKTSGVKRIIIAALIIAVISSAVYFCWYYLWSGNANFEYLLQPVVTLEGRSVSPGDFLDPDFRGNDLIKASFTDRTFIPKEGHQSVSLTLTLGRHNIKTTADLYVLTTIDRLIKEYKLPLQELQPEDFIANLEAAAGIPVDVRFTEEPLPLDKYDLGIYRLTLILNNESFEAALVIADTTPPAADPVDVESPIGEPVFPGQFLENVFDHSGIGSIEFVDEPDVMAHHMQDVEVRVTDLFGNSAVFRAGLTILLDDTPPVIQGTFRIVSRRGNPIIYRHGVTARDSFDRDLTEEIQIDSSNVNQNETGEYTVIYRVIDLSGLETVVPAIVQVVNVDVDYVNERIDAALADILNDGMSQLDQVKAIHYWVRNRISYASSRIEPENTYEGAYRALRDRQGNCFNYFSLAEVMLTRAGIPNIRIDRIPGTPTRHRWNLVNPDDLGWHHFDTTPVARMGFGSQTAFFTASEARDFTARIQNTHGMRDFYSYNAELYPNIIE